MTRLERMTDCPVGLDRKGRRTHGLMAVGGNRLEGKTSKKKKAKQAKQAKQASG